MKAPIPDHEEDLIVEYIYLNYLINILEYDLKQTKLQRFKIPEAWETFIVFRQKTHTSRNEKGEAQ